MRDDRVDWRIGKGYECGQENANFIKYASVRAQAASTACRIWDATNHAKKYCGFTIS